MVLDKSKHQHGSKATSLLRRCRMRTTFEKELRGLSEPEMENALKKPCEPLGGLREVTFRTTKTGDQLCFIELAVAENQTRLYSIFDGRSFGASFVVRIPR